MTLYKLYRTLWTHVKGLRYSYCEKFLEIFQVPLFIEFVCFCTTFPSRISVEKGEFNRVLQIYKCLSVKELSFESKDTTSDE